MVDNEFELRSKLVRAFWFHQASSVSFFISYREAFSLLLSESFNLQIRAGTGDSKNKIIQLETYNFTYYVSMFTTNLTIPPSRIYARYML